MLTAEFGAASAKAGSMPATVLAMSGGGIQIDFDRTVLLQALLFMVLVVILKPLLFDPVIRVFEAREKRTEGARAEAREMQDEAGELLQRYERELNRIREVASEERERLRVETAKLEAEILLEGQRAAAQTLEDGRRQIKAEGQAVRFELGQAAERLAKQMAARVLGREVS
jgi:F-type H+-transporting ATPase subunit b